MPTGQDHEISELAQSIRQEIADDAKEHAQVVLGEVLPDTFKAQRPKYLAWIRAGWPDPQFRQTLLDRLAPAGSTGLRPVEGVKKYLQDTRDAWKDHAETVLAAQQMQPPQSMPAADAVTQMVAATPAPSPVASGPLMPGGALVRRLEGA